MPDLRSAPSTRASGCGRARRARKADGSHSSWSARMAELPGQISSLLPGGGLALSCAKPIEEGARAALLLAPGLFRIDACPQEDTLRLQVRNLGEGPCDWSEGGRPLVLAASEGLAVSGHTLRLDLGG